MQSTATPKLNTFGRVYDGSAGHNTATAEQRQKEQGNNYFNGKGAASVKQTDLWTGEVVTNTNWQCYIANNDAFDAVFT
jgi:hypothetical protein